MYLFLTELTDREDVYKTYDVYKWCMYAPTKEKFHNKVDSFLCTPNVRIFACVQGEEVVGVTVASFVEGCRLEIVGIAVALGHRNKGIGTYMLQQLADRYRATCIYAETDDDAVGFYCKNGFSVTSFIEKYDDGEVLRYKCEKYNTEND